MNLIKLTILLFSLTLIVSSCKEDPEITAAIVGKWNGDEADFKVNPSGIIPAFTLNESEFPVQLEFKADNSLVLTDSKGVNRNGTYTLAGNKLTIAIDYTFELIELSGEYDIKELTSTNLSASIEKEGSYMHPDSGQQFDGKVTATLFFIKGSN